MRRRFENCVGLLALLLLLPRPSPAQTPPAGPSVPDDTQPVSSRVGAVIYSDYTYQRLPKTMDAAGNSISPSSFNLTRAYLNITGNISHVVSYRITPDINPVRFTLAGNNMDGSYLFRVKYAFAQLALDDWTGQWKSTWVRLGVQQTPIVDWLENVYRYRFQGTVFIERDGGLSSSDAGVSFHTNLPRDYGEIHVGVYNGENYNRSEPNDQKALMARVTVRPLPSGGTFGRGIRLTAFRVNDHVVKGAERIRTVGGALLEQRWYTLGVEYLSRSDQTLPTSVKVEGDGYSVWATPFFKEKGHGPEALVRYDSVRPNSTNKDSRQNRLIVGVAYWFPHPGGAGTAALLLDYEQVTFKHIASPKEQRIILHGLINF